MWWSPRFDARRSKASVGTVWYWRRRADAVRGVYYETGRGAIPMPDHGTLRQESPDNTQRKRIEALAQDPEMQQVAATARPRGPERSPQPGNPDKQRMKRRLATMAETAERDPEIKQRIQEREKAARKGIRPGRQKTEAEGQQLVPTSWDDRRHVNLAGPLANTRHVVPARELRDGQTALPFDYDLLQRSTQPPPAKEPRFEVGYLPFLEIESRLVPSALLDLWDTGAGRGKHGPVPLPLASDNQALVPAWRPAWSWKKHGANGTVGASSSRGAK